LNTLIKRINPQNFQENVIEAAEPLVVLCMPRDDDFPDQLRSLELAVGGCKAHLSAAFVDESFLETFKGMFHITGTPTYLFFYKAMEINRMLGIANRQTIESFFKESFGKIIRNGEHHVLS
jgi:hypothetical protein